MRGKAPAYIRERRLADPRWVRRQNRAKHLQRKRSAWFNLFCACIQWNREHGGIIPPRRTRWEVVRVTRREFRRLWELGRKR